MTAKGRAHVYGDNVDTDVIIPARYLNTSSHTELAAHCMEDIDKEFVSRVHPGDIVAGGRNFGCGSSREHAPIALKACGVSCVIAHTFARIFYRNAINIGLPILECPAAAAELRQDDTVSVDFASGAIVNHTRNKTYQAEPFPPFIQAIIQKGGLMNMAAQAEYPYPLKLMPVFKNYLWGGRRLIDDFQMESPDIPCAEAWLLSCHKDGSSVVENGPLQGRTLQEAIEAMGPACLGTKGRTFDYFPILIKLIDAEQSLSIQVHPDDEYARKMEGEYGKTEMWYVVDCEEDSFIYYGFDHEISKEEFRAHIENNTLTEVLHKQPCRKGDCYFIEAGTLHAIGAGLLIAEIQQNSNSTYRIYDFNRKDPDGKLRPLHVDKAVEVTKTVPPAPSADFGPPVAYDGYTQKTLAECRYFTVTALDIKGKTSFIADDSSFVSVTVLEGQGVLSVPNQEPIPLKKGDSLFLPAGLGDCLIDGTCQALLSRV